jgi:transposase-like protein
MTFERLRQPPGPPQDDSALKPAACPECRSKKFGTLAAIVTRDTYWRCHECGNVWNEIRHRQQHKRQW